MPVEIPSRGLANYGFFGRTEAGFRSTMFRSAPKAVQDAAVKLHYPDPCGDNYSLIDTIQKQAANVAKVRVPVLVVCGTKDVLYAPFGCEAQAERFKKGRSPDSCATPATGCRSSARPRRFASASAASSIDPGSSAFCNPARRP